MQYALDKIVLPHYSVHTLRFTFYLCPNFCSRRFAIHEFRLADFKSAFQRRRIANQPYSNYCISFSISLKSMSGYFSLSACMALLILRDKYFCL